MSATRNLTVTNDPTSNDNLVVSGIAYPTAFTGPTAGFTLAPGASQTVPVTFTPTAPQTYSGNITVTSNSTSGPNTIAVSGRGVARIVLLIGDLSFGDVVISVP